MINIILALFFLNLITMNNLLIFQIQYYDFYRLIINKLKKINYKYLLIIPFILVEYFYFDKRITFVSLLLFVLFNIPVENKLKFTFRVKRLLLFSNLINLVFLLMNDNYIFISFILVILNIFVIGISNLLDYFNRMIIKYICVRNLKTKLNHINPLIIGITGSYGKTSTKKYLYNILKKKYNVLTTSGNINTFKGVINYLNKYLNNDIDILIIEIGLDKKKSIDKFLKLFKFDYAFLTGIEKCHLATFKSIDNIINEKMKLIKSSKVGFVNISNNYLKESNYNSYSISDLEYINYIDHLTHFKIKNNPKEFKTKVLGDHQIINIIGVIKFLKYINFDEEIIYQSLLTLKNEEHRYELKNLKELLVIDDAYNSNETGFKYAIDSLRYFNKKKILITPGVIELGKENKEVNYRVGKYVINKVDEVLLVGLNSLSIKVAFDNEGFKNYLYFDTFREAFSYLENRENKDFIVLIENDLLDYYID